MFSSGRLELDSEAARACIYAACRIKRYITNDKPQRWDACFVLLLSVLLHYRHNHHRHQHFHLNFLHHQQQQQQRYYCCCCCVLPLSWPLLAPWLQYRHLLAVTGRQLPRVFVTRSCHNVYCWCGQGKVSGHDVSSDCSFLLLLLLLYIILV